MEDIDKIIKDTLTQEEAKFYDSLEEQNLIKQFGGLFKTKQSWLIIIMNIINFIVFALSIYCLAKFFSTNVTNELIKWAVLFFICWSAISMIKLFVWMQMDKNALLRELKRLELQVAALAGKSKE